MRRAAAAKARRAATAGFTRSEEAAAGSPREAAATDARWTAASPAWHETAASDANGSAPAGDSPTSTAAHAAASLPRIPRLFAESEPARKRKGGPPVVKVAAQSGG